MLKKSFIMSIIAVFFLYNCEKKNDDTKNPTDLTDTVDLVNPTDTVVNPTDTVDVVNPIDTVVNPIDTIVNPIDVTDLFPEPKGTKIRVTNVSELEAAVKRANSENNIDIIFASGTYQLRNMIWLTGNNITFRSETGKRDDVILKGRGMTGGISHIFNLTGKNVSIGNLTLGWISQHAVQVHGENDADNFLAHNLRFVDTGEQMLKVSYKSGDAAGADNGIVRFCMFEYTAKVGPQYYIGGVDAHQAKDWVVKGNVFKHIKSPDKGLAEHAIHFWSDCQGTIVERNQITDCDRGIGFGLGNRGHGDGIIRNNMVHTTRDVGIGLENANGVLIYNNSVVTENYNNAIEYRFGNTSATIINNLTIGIIRQREGGKADLSNNFDKAKLSWFKDPKSGDLHLTSIQMDVIDAGKTVSEVKYDFDREARPSGNAYDIGADEIK